MNDRCPHCSLLFNREAGYFLGAMYISYGLSLIVIFLFSALLWGVTSWSLERDIVIASLIFLPLVPLLVTVSRVLWIHMDRAFDPDSDNGT